MNLSAAALFRLVLFSITLLAAVDGVAAAGETAQMQVHHELSVSLFPEASTLQGRDRIRIVPAPTDTLKLVLSSKARIQHIELNGREHPYAFDQGTLELVPGPRKQASLDLVIRYTCRFDDPVPERPLNTDNPGYGVSGTISIAGTFILSGAGWYPRVPDSLETIALRLDGPTGTVAVTAGRLDTITQEDNRTVSRWTSTQPLEGLSLSAGDYVVDRQTKEGFSAATYLFAQDRHLAGRYLEASLGYLKRYSDLFGAYPYETFSVVENFFPTGYGFPGYTLMGGVVLRLPFIPFTSLPHEIVHNWWGNGVLVDFAAGNWCEGLTTYTADYLLKEQASPDAARDYRRQAMRNFASLVSPSTDLPLVRFRSRTDPATKAVGYDKCAMVFHMLRRTVGEDVFWQGLRDLYEQFRFKRASWKDIQRIFETRAHRSLEVFFAQWIERPGAPRLHLEQVRYVADANGYLTTGRLVQEAPFYDVSLDVVVETDDDTVRHSMRMSDHSADFSIQTTGRPVKLIADPDDHLFRKLAREELPPTVNDLRGAESVVVIVSDRLGRAGKIMAGNFCRAMGIDPIRIVSEADYSPSANRENGLVFIGLPKASTYRHLFSDASSLSDNGFEVEGRRFSGAMDVLFLVSRPDGGPGGIVGLLHPLSPEAADPVIAKIPHYGRYSYLVFSDGNNRIKGTWNILASPMRVSWQQEAANQ